MNIQIFPSQGNIKNDLYGSIKSPEMNPFIHLSCSIKFCIVIKGFSDRVGLSFNKNSLKLPVCFKNSDQVLKFQKYRRYVHCKCDQQFIVNS